MKKIFKDIPGYEGFYKINNLGEIISITRYRLDRGHKKILKGKKLKVSNRGNGYTCIVLYKNGKRKMFSVHKLVALTFINNVDNKPQVNHINGIKHDNRLENLEWCTMSENIKHSYRKLGRKISNNWLGKFGKLHPLSKPVRQITKLGQLIKIWESILLAENTLNINNVNACLSGKQKTAGGFKWEYSN